MNEFERVGIGADKKRIGLASLRWLAALPFFVCAAWSQNTTGSLSGVIADPQGAVIPSAKVEVINQDTGVVTPLTTNDAGVYRAAFLIPGKYTVRVSAAGFRTFESKDIVVELAREPNVNATLQVGSASEVVEVTGSAAPAVCRKLNCS